MVSVAQVNGLSVGGSLAAAGGIFDNGLPGYSYSLGGSLASATIEDIGLPIYAQSLCGSLGQSTLEEDAIYTQDNIYGVAFMGSLMHVRMFIDPSEAYFRRYWSESDYQLGGSAVDCGNTAGSVEGEGNA